MKKFAFAISLVLVVFAGYFAWDAVIGVGGDFINKILDYTDKIGAKIFTASFFQNDNQFIDLTPVFDEILIEDVGDNLGEDEITPEAEERQEVFVVEKKSKQDLLDDIQEKLDIIQQQVTEIIAEQNPDLQKDEEKEVTEEEFEEEETEKELIEEDIQEELAENIEENICPGGININTASAEDLDKISGVGPVTAQKIIGARPFYALVDLLRVSGIGEKTLQEIINQGCVYVEPGLFPPMPSSGGGGGSTPTIYPKILISEVQQSPTSQRFIELYNPNSIDVSLTDWYLQRKTKTADSWGSCVSSTKFAGKSISASGYFVISRSDESTDIFLDNLTITEDNSFALKNPSREISDKLGFGLALDFEAVAAVSPGDAQTISRKVLDGDTEPASQRGEQDTDNNFDDFELGSPTPGMQNITWSEPIPPSLESIEITTLPEKLAYFVSDELDIFGLEIIGFFDDGSSQDLSITLDNISGFDNTTPSDAQILTITYEDKTASYEISISAESEQVDTTLPNGTIMINDGVEYTNTRDVILTLSATDDFSDVVEMRVANGSYYYDWEPYGALKEWKLPATNGVKTVRVKFKDVAGNENTPGIPATIILDTVLPVITLNGEAEINLDVGDVYEELGVTVFDLNIADDALVISGDVVETVSPANFHVFYDAMDFAGNSAEQVARIVTVK